MSVDEYRPPPPTVPPTDGAPAQPVDEELYPIQPGPAPRPQRSRFLPRTLTARLVVGVVSLVAVLVVLIGVGTYYALRSFLYDKLDQQLASAASQNATYVDRCTQRYLPTPASGTLQCFTGAPPPQHEWLIARMGTVELTPTESFPNVSTLDLTRGQFAAIAASPDSVRTITTDSERLRVTARSNDDGLLVVTGLSTDDVSTTLQRLIVLEFVIGAAALVIASTATGWGVRRSLRNLYRVTGTAQEVAAELSPEGRGLDRRVPVTDEGTEVGQLAESMNTLLSAVETQFAARLESEQRMRQFLADASHELRTPLTSIRGYAELAQLQRAKGDTAEDNLARIESEGTRMSRLVEDLLLLARGDAEGESPNPELIDVTDLLDEAVSGARAAFPEREVGIELVGDPHVVGDRDQLIRVVRNLVANAAVHTRRDRPIRVRGFADEHGVTIQVVDGGPGLPPEQAAHVFERFWRADKARTRARGGSGLGLSIVAAIVRAHGGSVRFHSTVENGSTVTVWLPRAQAI